jgi:hypothetical protein
MSATESSSVTNSHSVVPYIVGVFAAQIGNGGKNLIWSNMLS